MENSIYLTLSRQLAVKNNMDVIANNIANMNTSGYRARNMVFSEYVSDVRGDIDPMSFGLDSSQYSVTDGGPLSQTGNPLDIAVVGPGFIQVQTEGGKPAYTRAGNLQLGADGSLRTSAGFMVASQGGGSIVIPPGSSDIKIDERGVVSNQNGQLGQIGVMEFENIQQLTPLGNNLYTSDKPPLPATESRIKQGHLEGSNVKPVLEMTRMIETLRSFQSMQNIMQNENERLRGAIQKLTEQN